MIKKIISSLFVLYLATNAFAATEETWSCESDNNNLPQSLELKIIDGVLISFDYSSMAPTGNDSTYTSCSLGAKRNSSDSTWKEKGEKTVIKLIDSAEKKDKVIARRDDKTISLEFKVSPTNCGHSTPLASGISITQGNKNCHSIVME